MQLKNVSLQRQSHALGTEGKCPWAVFTWGPTSRGQHSHTEWHSNTDRGPPKTVPRSVQLILPLCPELLIVQNLTQTAEFTEWHMWPDTPVWLPWPYCTFCDTQSPPENTRPSTPEKLETYTNLYRHSSFLFSCRRLKCHTWTSKLWVYNSPGLLILKPFYQSIPKPPLPGWLSMIVFEDLHMCKLNQNSTVGFT